VIKTNDPEVLRAALEALSSEGIEDGKHFDEDAGRWLPLGEPDVVDESSSQ
jgi:hypothetical protein